MNGDERPLAVLGKYELLRRLGVGGMAEVFVARTHGAEGFVKHLVIKRILPAFSEDEEFVRMFIAEARLAAKLQHANIVQIFEFDQINGSYYIAMEWVDGVDLRALRNEAVRRNMPINTALAVHVGVETLKGLHYAHSRTEAGRPLGLVHRDISPHNLLVSFSGEVKVTDFGIAKAAALAAPTKSGMVKGKLAYMSPEQVGGGPVDHRTDIYALGIVLWELLANRRLYQGASSEGELMARVREGRVPTLNSVVAELPTGLADIVERMLATDVAARYATAGEALGDLSAFVGGRAALDLEVYLRRLLPAQAERHERGLTAVMPIERQYTEAAPGAPTRTHDDRPAIDAADLIVASAQPAGRPRGRWALAAALAVVAAVSSYFASAHWGVEQPLAAGERSELTIESRPTGASVQLDDVALQGATPVRAWVGRGATVAVAVTSGGRTVRRVYHAAQLTGTVAFDFEAGAARLPGLASRPALVAGAAGAAAAGREASSANQNHGESKKTAPPKEAPPRRSARSSRASREGRSRERGVKMVHGGTGTLRVVVEPWAEVVVDHGAARMTPLTLRLPVGPHTIELRNRELGRKENTVVRIAPGRSANLRRVWR